jgi:hypothetical protein
MKTQFSFIRGAIRGLLYNGDILAVIAQNGSGSINATTKLLAHTICDSISNSTRIHVRPPVATFPSASPAVMDIPG